MMKNIKVITFIFFTYYLLAQNYTSFFNSQQRLKIISA